jgi:hypothetical protein
MEQLIFLKPSLQKRQKHRDKRLGEEVIECYRRGRHTKKMKGYDKKFKANNYEQAHAHESIKFMHGGGTRYFNDNLNPMIKYLNSHVGKNWNKVQSELCSKLNKNTINGLHVFNHLYDFVKENTFIENKKIFYIRYGRTEELISTARWPKFYINEKTGQLTKAPTLKKTN